MSTPEQPDNPPLTRKQLREIRTAATAIVTPEQLAAAASPDQARAEASAPEVVTTEPLDTESVEDSAAEEHPAAPVAAVPLARAAVPVELAPAPLPDASIDLGVAPLTRRQARQQELIRTASVPVVTPDLLAADAAARDEPSTTEADDPEESPINETADAAPAATTEAEAAAEDAATLDSEDAPSAESAPEAEAAQEAEDAPAADTASESADESDGPGDDASERPTVNPALGSDVLAAGSEPVSATPSFDQLLTRGTSATGSVATPNALILTQTPEGAIMAPVAATGEVLITGSFNLPDGLGSQGHPHGTTDGKEVDAVLIDGELPAHSSPTPIAASAAVSTVKTTGDIIRPPAPEKGGRLMLTLAITAGALALALIGLFVVAFATGVLR